MAEAIKLRGSNRNTLKQHVCDQAAKPHLEAHGSGRGAWYGIKYRG